MAKKTVGYWIRLGFYFFSVVVVGLAAGPLKRSYGPTAYVLVSFGILIAFFFVALLIGNAVDRARQPPK